MKKKSPQRPSVRDAETWHKGGTRAIIQYARSIRLAARILVGRLDVERSATTEWDICPIVLLYRQTLELYLKLLIGEGRNFLSVPTDPISLSTTHSLRWLAQITCQIIRAVGWQNEFRCDRVASLAEFSALVNEVEAFDPVDRAICSAGNGRSVEVFLRTFDIFQFAMKLEDIIELLVTTTDVLSAEWRRIDDSAEGIEIGTDDDSKPTIH